MKPYKVLCRHYYKFLKWPLIYFIVIDVLFLFNLNRSLFKQITDTLAIPRVWTLFGLCFYDALYRPLYYWGIAHLIGIVLVTTFLFYHHIHSESFLKSLPIKSSRQFLIKLMCGVSSYTLPFILLAIMTLIIRSIYLQDIRDYALLSYNGSIERVIDSLPFLFYTLLMSYLTLTFCYALIVLFQSLITQPLAATIFALIIAYGPLYFLRTFSAFCKHHLTHSLAECMTYFYRHYGYLWNYAFSTPNIAPSAPMPVYPSIYYHEYTIKFLLLLILMIISLSISYQTAEHLTLEHYERLIPSKTVRLLLSFTALIYMLITPMYLKETMDVTGFAGTPIGLCAIFLGECGIAFLLIKKYREVHNEN